MRHTTTTLMMTILICVAAIACGDPPASDDDGDDFNIDENAAANDDKNNGDQCPDPDADDVLYYSTSEDGCDGEFVPDPLCGEGQEKFDDECGCGCIADDDYLCHVDDCPPGTYCTFEESSCGEDGSRGTCDFVPSECTADVAEVCGCDGEIYIGSSSCAAQDAGVSSTAMSHCISDDCPDPESTDVDYMAYSREYCESMFPDFEDVYCDGDDDMQPFLDDCGCGCIAGDDHEPDDEVCDIDGCPDGQYCHYDDGACGNEGADGVCEPVPTDCTDDQASVCGCDGETHHGSSSCAAQDAGVDRDTTGAACQ